MAVTAPTPGDSPSQFNAADDGIIPDKSAGLGIELENTNFHLTSKLCTDFAKKNFLKAKTLGGRTGTNWELTVDTTISGNALTPECELKGDHLVGCVFANDSVLRYSGRNQAQIKRRNSYESSRRGERRYGEYHKTICTESLNLTAFVQIKWKPKIGDAMTIESDTYKDWRISKAPADITGSLWGIQATAPMPLAGINDLFELAAKNQASKSVLHSGLTSRTNRMVWVNKDFFKLKPQGNSDVSNDALGFLSMLMTYTKGVHTINDHIKRDESPKMMTSIMPRTYFTTMFDLVKADLKFTSTTTGLYDLIKVLSCYKVYFDDTVDIMYAIHLAMVQEQLRYTLIGSTNKSCDIVLTQRTASKMELKRQSRSRRSSITRSSSSRPQDLWLKRVSRSKTGLMAFRPAKGPTPTC